MKDQLEEKSRYRRSKYLWLGYLGWIITSSLALLLKVLGYSTIKYSQLAAIVAAASLAHVVSLATVRAGFDRRFSFDPHFVIIPNWLFFAPMVAYGYYALGEARGLMQVGWFMGFFFCSGYVRFWGVMATACWYMIMYLGVCTYASIHGQPVDLLKEFIRSGIFLAVCVFFAFLMDLVAAQKEYLKASLKALKEKDRTISVLNEKLAKFVTKPLVEELARDESGAILKHQRRKITVFFSDIQDFSIITDAMEPEELAQLLNEYFAEMIHIVSKFGGMLDKLMGDGLIAIFGAPSQMEPAKGALQAIRMAENMRERLKILNKKWRSQGIPFPIRVRMGINTGLNIVGSFGSDVWANYTAIGAQVNIAARLQQIAEPDQILLSHSTYVLVADQIEVKPFGETFLKGSHFPIKVYQFESFVKQKAPVAVEWQTKGCTVSLQPELLEVPDKDNFLAMLEKFLGKPVAGR